MEIKRIKKTIWFVVIALFAILVLKPVGETLWAQWMGFVAMHTYDDRLISSWQNKSTDFLIGKLGHPAVSYDGAARVILAKRKDPKKEEKIVSILESKFSSSRRKTSALGILFAWNEKKAIAISMEILNSGPKNPLYHDALLHLSRRKYEPAYSFVLALAKASDKYNNGSAAYLKDFGKLESIPILQGMLEEPGISSLDRRIISDAIESIKKQNGISSQEKDSNQ